MKQEFCFSTMILLDDQWKDAARSPGWQLMFLQTTEMFKFVLRTVLRFLQNVPFYIHLYESVFSTCSTVLA